jgi:hypothetical protein
MQLQQIRYGACGSHERGESVGAWWHMEGLLKTIIHPKCQYELDLPIFMINLAELGGAWKSDGGDSK